MNIKQQNGGNMEQRQRGTLTLGTAEKIIGMLMLVGGVATSIAGNYYVTNWRLQEDETHIEKIDNRTTTLEANGQPDQARRLLKLETVTDEHTISLAGMSAKLDNIKETAERIEKRLDERSAANPQANHDN